MFSGPLKTRIEAEKGSYLLIWVGQKEEIYSTRGPLSTKTTKVNKKHILIALKDMLTQKQIPYSLDTNFIFHFISFHLSLYYKIYRHIIRVTLHEWIYNIMLFTFILHQLVN